MYYTIVALKLNILNDTLKRCQYAKSITLVLDYIFE